LLWHPNAIINSRWWNLYLRSLEYLKEKNAWFGSVSNIARHYFELNSHLARIS